MTLLTHLFLYKIKSLFVLSFDLKLKTLLKNFAAGLIYILFAYGTYKVSSASLFFALHEIKIDVFIFHKIVAILLFMFFLSVNAGNILVSIGGLFRGKEVNYYFTKPIPFENIFLVKFLENFFYSSGTLFMILFAALYAYANYFHLHFSFYFFAIFCLFVPFTLIAALTGILILFTLIHIANKIGVQTTGAILILLYFITLSVFFAFNDPAQLLIRAISNQALALSIVNNIDHTPLTFSPNYWVSYSMYSFTLGNYLSAGMYSLFLIITASVLFIITYSIAKRWYYPTFTVIAGLQAKNKIVHFTRRSFLSFETTFSKFAKFEALVKKEIVLFSRDPAQVIHLLSMLLLVTIFIYSIKSKPNDFFTSINPSTQTIIYLTLVLFNYFMVNSLAMRFLFPIMSMEGQTYWKIRSAPVNIKKFYIVKFTCYFNFLLLGSESLNYFTHTRFHFELLLFSSIITFIVTLTLSAVNFFFGCFYVDYKEINAIKIASSQGASTSFLLCIIYLGIIIALLFPEIFDYFVRTQNLKQVLTFSFFIGSLLKIVPASIIIIFICYRLTIREVVADFTA